MQPNLKSDDDVWITACAQYEALAGMCSDRSYYNGVRALEQTGVMRLAARFGFRELIAREAHERLGELLSTKVSYAGVIVSVPTPLTEAICGAKQPLPGFELPSVIERQFCIKDILEVAPESANIPDPNGSMPLELAAALNEPFFVEAIVPYVSDVNAGWYTPTYYAVLNENTAPPGIELYKSQAIKNRLLIAGGMARQSEIAEISKMLEPGTYAFETYSRRPQRLLQQPSS